MIEPGEPSRDLNALSVGQDGSLQKTGDPFEPYRLLDGSGRVVAPVAAYLRDMQARGLSEAQTSGTRFAPIVNVDHVWVMR